jgi:hypothetical protein
MQSQAIGALPDSQFILNNQPVERPQTLTTSAKAGRKAATVRRGSHQLKMLMWKELMWEELRRNPGLQGNLGTRNLKYIRKAPALEVFSNCSFG